MTPIHAPEFDLAEVYDRFRPFVYQLAARISRDKAGAEDVTQEVFLQLWRDPARFDPNLGTMRAWLGTVTHRTAVAWVRKQVAAHRRDERAVGVTDVPMADEVEETALLRVVAARVRAAVANLPNPQRRAVELAYFHGLTFRQVADRLGIPEGTAKSRLRLGLNRLSQQLA